MDLGEIRNKIDVIDDQIANLYGERMKLVQEVSNAKKQTGKAVNDPDREKKILMRVTDKVDEKAPKQSQPKAESKPAEKAPVAEGDEAVKRRRRPHHRGGRRRHKNGGEGSAAPKAE